MHKIRLTCLLSFMLTFQPMTLKSETHKTYDVVQALKWNHALQPLDYELRAYQQTKNLPERVEGWLSHPKNLRYTEACLGSLSTFFAKAKDSTLPLLCYFLRQKDTTTRQLYFSVAKKSILETARTLAQLRHDPRLPGKERRRAEELLKSFEMPFDSQLQTCFHSVSTQINQGLAEHLYGQIFASSQKCLQENFSHLILDLKQEFPLGASQWIPGNQVTYLFDTPPSEDLLQTLNERQTAMRTHYPLTGKGGFNSFVNKILTAPSFTEKEGFFELATDPLWNQQGSVFKDIAKALGNAKESVFVDVAYIGSTMGASLAKYLVELSQKNIKVFILGDLSHQNSDYAKNDSLPVFNYLMAYSYRYPERMVVSGTFNALRSPFLDTQRQQLMAAADINQTRSALTADDSSIIVIDGKSSRPTAYIGSKQFAPGLGKWILDGILKIEGPAASVVQDDYFMDMFYALSLELDDRLLKNYAQSGWGKEAFKNRSGRAEWALNILKPFALVPRDTRLKALSNAPLAVETQGEGWVSLGQNSADGAQVQIEAQLTSAIALAKEKIFIQNPALLSAKIVQALVLAKVRDPQLDIRILAAQLNSHELLNEVGIYFRAFPGPHQFNLKTLSIDGEILSVGTASLDPASLSRAFRQEQVWVFDKNLTRTHDDSFEKNWSSSMKTKDASSLSQDGSPRLRPFITQLLMQ